MARPSAVVQTHAAAFVVAMIEAQLLDEAQDFVEWYLDEFDSDLSYALPAEFEGD